jgi:hypothetical protein
MSADERAAEIEAGLKILVQGLVEVRRRLDGLEAREEGTASQTALAPGLPEIARALERVALVGERIAAGQQRLDAGREGLTQAVEEQTRIGERIAAAVERLAEK